MADVPYSQQNVFDANSEFSVIAFIVRQALGRARFAIPATVQTVHGGGVGAPPTVDVQVAVNLIDGIGQQSSHGTIFGLPVFRLQGGPNAIIIDPVAGDVGFLVVSDRDISALKANAGAVSNPGSYRRNDLADAVYFGGIVNPADPTQAVQFTSTGLKVFDKNGNIIEMKASGITITPASGTATVNGNLNVTGEVTAGAGGADSVGLQTHEHPTAAIGSPSPPTPGT